ISHHKVTSRSHWGLVRGTLGMLRKARERGVDITCDLYPYLATSTSLTATLPHWAHEGGLEKLIFRIRDASLKLKILDDLVLNQSPAGWHNIVISGVTTRSNKGLEGKNIADIASAKGLKPEEVVLKVIEEEEGNVGMIRFAMCEDDLEEVLRDDLSMIGSDGGSLADYGVLAKGKPHPRNFGTFPRILAKYWRERKLFSLERAVYKMTGFPSWRFGLQDRGLIRKGMAADLLIFDPATIQDEATYAEPFQYPTGIAKVIVAGEVVVDQGKHTGALPGRVLSREVFS
ncbi:MAG: amidohydrolase family protein, partial [Halanaerobium sp.]|nr:amidohydrolase family protein [Halanaerobium sp.]